MVGRGLAPAALGPPSDRSAIIVRASLPAGIERLRRRWVRNAADGVPAHMTLLHPFVAPERLTPEVRAAIATVAARHARFRYSLHARATWPVVMYVTVAPIDPFVELHADLQRTFPGFPIYGAGAGFAFVPHVTVAQLPTPGDADIAGDMAWAVLPRPAVAHSIELIARPPGARWRTIWRMRLGRMPA